MSARDYIYEFFPATKDIEITEEQAIQLLIEAHKTIYENDKIRKEKFAALSKWKQILILWLQQPEKRWIR